MMPVDLAGYLPDDRHTGLATELQWRLGERGVHIDEPGRLANQHRLKPQGLPQLPRLLWPWLLPRQLGLRAKLRFRCGLCALLRLRRLLGLLQLRLGLWVLLRLRWLLGLPVLLRLRRLLELRALPQLRLGLQALLRLRRLCRLRRLLQLLRPWAPLRLGGLLKLRRLLKPWRQLWLLLLLRLRRLRPLLRLRGLPRSRRLWLPLGAWLLVEAHLHRRLLVGEPPGDHGLLWLHFATEGRGFVSGARRRRRR